MASSPPPGSRGPRREERRKERRGGKKGARDGEEGRGDKERKTEGREKAEERVMQAPQAARIFPAVTAVLGLLVLPREGDLCRLGGSAVCVPWHLPKRMIKKVLQAVDSIRRFSAVVTKCFCPGVCTRGPWMLASCGATTGDRIAKVTVQSSKGVVCYLFQKVSFLILLQGASLATGQWSPSRERMFGSQP